MRRLGIALALLWIGFAAAGCHRAVVPPAQRSFYYWRTTFRLSAAEQDALVRLHVSRLFLRLFDVEWGASEGAPSTVGKILLAEGARLPDGVEVVPVVFLRDEVFRHLPPASAAELAATSWADVQERARLLGFEPRELQIDCDWSDSSREAFFTYLRRLGEFARPGGVALSATIRLHQVKYRERTGVPPVDRGMLMFYNMGRFSADPEARAIFDPESAGLYLARVPSYPLPLDVALPMWSWTVHLRDEHVEGLMQTTDPDELPAIPFLRADTAPGRFIATRTAFLHGSLLREGDVLKTEVTGPAESLAAASLIAPVLGAPAARTVSLFDLSERNLARYDTGQLEQVFRAFR